GVSRFDQYEDTAWPAWSPDGRYIAFRQRVLRSVTADPVETIVIREPGGLTAKTIFRSSEWVWNGERVTKRPENSAKPTSWLPRVSGIAWSPDSTKIAASFHHSLGHEGSSVWIIDSFAPNEAESAKIIVNEAQRLSAITWLNNNTVGVLRAKTRPNGNAY